MSLAPVIIFSYNRPNHLEKVVRALAENTLASESELFIFCDGAKEHASDSDKEKVSENIRVARQASGFKSLTVCERDRNYGLADNIIDAVTQIVNRFGKVITLEDDVITSKGFLAYMNDALVLYADDTRVMHISGYMYPHKEHLPETFFYEVPYPGGGWATWKRAWDSFSNNIEELYEYWRNNWKAFNKFGGDYLQRQMEANLNGTLYTWFIKWHATVLKMDGLTLYPCQSLTNNIGFDNSGTNCLSSSKFDIPRLAPSITVRRIQLKENKKAARIIYHFYSGHWYSKRYRAALISRIKHFFRIEK